MKREQYLSYIAPDKPVVEWTDQQLFDEVDFIATHRQEIHPTGEREEQLRKRMAKAVMEQTCRYAETHARV